jgi:hypothetical protein
MTGRQQETMAVAAAEKEAGGASLRRKAVVLVAAALAAASAEQYVLSDPSGNNKVIIDPSTDTFLVESRSEDALYQSGKHEKGVTYSMYCALENGAPCSPTNATGVFAAPDGHVDILYNGAIMFSQ